LADVAQIPFNKDCVASWISSEIHVIDIVRHRFSDPIGRRDDISSRARDAWLVWNMRNYLQVPAEMTWTKSDEMVDEIAFDISKRP
jgi:hypothetical protein